MKKKEKKQTANEEQCKVSMALLADLMAETFCEKKEGPLDDFEIYAHQLKSHLYVNYDSFRSRFLNGYDQLLHVLEDKKEEK